MLLSIGGARMSIEPLFHKNLPAHERFLLKDTMLKYMVLFFINKTISGAERILWIQHFLKVKMCTGRKYKLSRTSEAENSWSRPRLAR